MYKVKEGNFKTMEFMTGLSEFSVFNPLMSIAPTLKKLLGNFMTLKWSLAPCGGRHSVYPILHDK